MDVAQKGEGLENKTTRSKYVLMRVNVTFNLQLSSPFVKKASPTRKPVYIISSIMLSIMNLNYNNSSALAAAME
jgi:hypothetical protein